MQDHFTLCVKMWQAKSGLVMDLSLLAMIALLAVQSCAQIFIHKAIMLIDNSDNASFNQVHWLIRTPYLSIKASNGLTIYLKCGCNMKVAMSC